MLSFRISLYGIVSDVDSLSMMSVSHSMFARAPSARRPKWTTPRYVTFPPCCEMDFETIVDDVFGAKCIILAPASWCWPLPAKAIDNVIPRAPSPLRIHAGYFIVSFEPILPSIHAIVAFSSQTARFVTRMYTLFAQF